MIKLFEVINISAPHIYHSALCLSPKLSTVSGLYKQYSHSLVKIVQGLPISWEQIIASMYCGSSVKAAVWSPCNRFIAFAQEDSMKIEVVDATTLWRVKTFTSPSKNTQKLSFSPDGCLLTGLSDVFQLYNWDFQTGGLISTISLGRYERKGYFISPIHSMDGKVVATAYCGYFDNSTAISTYNLISRTHIYSHHPSEGRIVAPVWVHNEHLQFCTVKPGYITVWEVGFSSIDTLVEVKTLPAPDRASDSENLLFLPTLSRLAFALSNKVLVWDAQGSRFLLCFEGDTRDVHMDFSSDGQFFACGAPHGGIFIWRESPTGYTLHQELKFKTVGTFIPTFSPNKGSMIVCTPWGMQLWYTASPFSDTSIRSTSQSNFILTFPPDKTFAAVAHSYEEKITVVDLEGSDQQLSISAGMDVLSLGMTGRTVFAVGREKVFTWNVPVGGCGPNAGANIHDGVQISLFHNQDQCSSFFPSPRISISPNCSYIACIVGESGSTALNIYDVSTGMHLTGTAPGGTVIFSPVWFTWDNLEVWCKDEGDLCWCGWTITGGDKSGCIKLDPIGPGVLPSGGFPWQSSHGYEVRSEERRVGKECSS